MILDTLCNVVGIFFAAVFVLTILAYIALGIIRFVSPTLFDKLTDWIPTDCGPETNHSQWWKFPW